MKKNNTLLNFVYVFVVFFYIDLTFYLLVNGYVEYQERVQIRQDVEQMLNFPDLI